MEKNELTERQEGCQHQKVILSFLLVEKIRREASVFSQLMWMDMVHLKFRLNSFALVS
jgi:hypothetical protein